MGWGGTETIDRIEILDSGELFLGLDGKGKSEYQYVYREAAGVYWDPDRRGFKSTELKEWKPSDWFSHIVQIVRSGIGVELRLGESLRWNNISENEKKKILASR